MPIDIENPGADEAALKAALRALVFGDLPTVDPEVVGSPWNDNGVVSISEGPPPPAIVPVYVGTNVSASGLSSYTFTNEPVGAAHASRSTVVVVEYIQNGGATTAPTSVTIGGVPATRDAHAFGTGDAAFCGVYRLANPTGTTATIVVNLANAAFDCTIFVFSVPDIGSVVDTASVSGGAIGGSFVATLDVDTHSGGAVIAGSMAFNFAGDATWSGVTGSAPQTNVYGNDRRAVAHAEIVTGETPRAITATYADESNSYAAVAVSYGL